MPVVHLNEDLTNVTAFVDSMFDADVRIIDPIQDAITADERVMFFSPEDCRRILSVWMTAWMGSPDPRCPASDVAFLCWLQQQLSGYDLELYMPRISATSSQLSQSPPAYTLEGYAPAVSFFGTAGSPHESAGMALLTLLLAGAHIVVVLDSAHIPPGAQSGNLYDNFNATAFDIRNDPSNSHYLTGLTPWSSEGRYYLSITADKAPDPCPFLCAMLAGPTVSDLSDPTRDTFLQLEGWQEGELIGGIPSPFGWHNQDYDTLYKPTLWNVSTFGASAYSEKRGTTVFLAPSGWQPQTDPDTIMAPYAGSASEAEQSRWLDRSVVTLG